MELLADRLATRVHVEHRETASDGPFDLLADTAADTVAGERDEHVAVGLHEATVSRVDLLGGGIGVYPRCGLQSRNVDTDELVSTPAVRNSRNAPRMW